MAGPAMIEGGGLGTFDPKDIRDEINKEFLEISEAHHERYFKKAN